MGSFRSSRLTASPTRSAYSSLVYRTGRWSARSIPLLVVLCLLLGSYYWMQLPQQPVLLQEVVITAGAHLKDVATEEHPTHPAHSPSEYLTSDVAQQVVQVRNNQDTMSLSTQHQSSPERLSKEEIIHIQVPATQGARQVGNPLEKVVLVDDQSIHTGLYPQKVEVQPSSDQTLYLITATYLRATQRAELTRVAQTVMSIPNCHWLIVEDAIVRSPWIEDTLTRLGIKHTIMACKKTPQQAKAEKKTLVANGYIQRNCALDWLEENNIEDGVLYFLDDDNSFDLRGFEEIRTAKKVVMVPTGNLIGSAVSSPLFANGKIVDWIDPWPVDRKYPIDMASFSINVGFWRERGAPRMCNTRGYLETRLLGDLKLDLSEIVPRAENCTKVYYWHTQTSYDRAKPPKAADWNQFMKKHPDSNLALLQKAVSSILK